MSVKPKLYIISGLAADEQVFARLQLNQTVSFLKWIPHHQGETLASYATRMAEQIPEKEDCMLLGLSFGGIIAQEIAAQRPVKQLIILSSVTRRRDIPWYYRFAGALGIPLMIPNFIYRRSNRLLDWMFSMKEGNEKRLLDTYIRGSNPKYIKWALSHIARWKPPALTCPIIQIHGQKDRVFPKRWIGNHIPLSGGHFSVFSYPQEASRILNQLLDRRRD